MSSRLPDSPDPFEEEGLPGMQDGLPEKRATGDAQEGIDPPRDYATAVEDYGTTAAEEAAGEPLELRVSREEPDVLARADLPASAPPPQQDPDEPAGRLTAPDQGAHADEEKDAVASDVGTDEGGYAAEEAAVEVHPDR